MLKASREQRFFWAAIIIYLIVVACFSVSEYFKAKHSLLMEVDQQLYRSAVVANNLLVQELRDDVASDRELTFDEDYLLAVKLQHLADSLSVEYVYSLKKQDGHIVFLSSNMSPEERQSASYEPVHFTIYDDAPVAVYASIADGQPRFFQYKDRWGYFRSLFLPFVDQNQRSYLIGVDVNIDQLQAIAIKSLLKAILYGSLLVLIVLPLIFLYSRLFKRHYSEKLKAAETHPVTGLPNKRCLVRKIELSSSTTQHLLLIRVENFHDICNLSDVSFGDELLLKVRYCLREVSVLGIEHCEFYHLDESLFGVYSQYSLSRYQQKTIVSQVYKDLVKLHVRPVSGRSISLALRLSTASNDSDVYTLARMSLNYAASHDKAFVEYQPTLELPAYFQRRLDIHHALSESINNGQVKVFYQPIVDNATGKAVKYEALVRLLNNPSGNVISTEEFMSAAYQSRLCHKLTRIVLDEVIECVKEHKKTVSINLSIKDLFDQATREYLIQQIRRHKVGKYLEFELLEQQNINGYKQAAAYIRQLKSCVAAIGIDDLGKLYSNFDRLLELPLDFVKIDGVLIESLISNQESQSIVLGIVQFAQNKGMKVIAEFCSSREVCQKVSDMNIHLMQGFYISEPKDSIDHADAAVAQGQWGFG